MIKPIILSSDKKGIDFEPSLSGYVTLRLLTFSSDSLKNYVLSVISKDSLQGSLTISVHVFNGDYIFNPREIEINYSPITRIEIHDPLGLPFKVNFEIELYP